MIFEAIINCTGHRKDKASSPNNAHRTRHTPRRLWQGWQKGLCAESKAEAPIYTLPARGTTFAVMMIRGQTRRQELTEFKAKVSSFFLSVFLLCFFYTLKYKSQAFFWGQNCGTLPLIFKSVISYVIFLIQNQRHLREIARHVHVNHNILIQNQRHLHEIARHVRVNHNILIRSVRCELFHNCRTLASVTCTFISLLVPSFFQYAGQFQLRVSLSAFPDEIPTTVTRDHRDDRPRLF